MASKFLPSREFLLVAACCAWPPSEARTNMVREAAVGAMDWNRFRRLVDRHRVPGLVHNAVTRAEICLPAQIAEDIAAVAIQRASRDLALAAEAIRLNRLLNKNGVTATFVKGATLGILAYGQLGMRDSKDIDILVSERDVPAAADVLEHAGYFRSDPPEGTAETALSMWKVLRKDYAFVHRTQHHVVELHWRLFDNPHISREPFGTSPLKMVAIGVAGDLPTLGEEDLYAYLCLHGALTGWMRLKWLADVAALVSVMPPGSIEQIHEAAEARNAGPASAQALLLCHMLFRTDIPAPLLARLKRTPHVLGLKKAALWALTSGHELAVPLELPFGGLRINLTHFLLARGRRYREMELKLLLASPIDALMLPLPESFHFLYPALRLPLWIWRKLDKG